MASESNDSPDRAGRAVTEPIGDDYEIPPEDEDLLGECRVETFRAGGPGGQHQNKSESGVRLVHLPTGVRVVAREERSQHRNRRRAVERLRARLVELMDVPEPRKPTKVSRSQKAKRLEEKKRRGRTKKLRRKPEVGDE